MKNKKYIRKVQQRNGDNKIICFYFFVCEKGHILLVNIVWENVV